MVKRKAYIVTQNRMYITEKKLLLYALVSNAIYIFLLFLFMPNGINLQKLIISSFLAFSVAGVLMYCYKNRKLIKQLPKTARIVFILLMIHSSIVVIRGFSTDIQDWVTNFGNVYMALAWFTPILIVVGQKIENWKIVFQAIFIMFQIMLLSMLFLPFHVGGKLHTQWTWLIRSVNFILIIGINRFKLYRKVLALLALIIYLILAIETQQRIEFVYLTLILAFGLIEKYRHIKIKKRILRLAIFSFLLLLLMVFTYGYKNVNDLVNKIVEFEDSRTFLFTEISDELSIKEKFFGRGSLGTYYSDWMEKGKNYYINVLKEPWWGDSSTRITVEVGYLQMILKGGAILFLLTLFLMLYSSYLALLKAKNKFIRRLGLYILIISILSLISFRPAFTPTFIILWIAIGTVLNKRNRMMSDQEISKHIQI